MMTRIGVPNSGKARVIGWGRGELLILFILGSGFTDVSHIVKNNLSSSFICI